MTSGRGPAISSGSVLAAFLTTILFAVSAVCGQRSARLLGGAEANFWRLCLGAALLALYAHGLGAGLTGAAFPVFLASGCVGFGLGDAAYFEALPRLGSRLSVMMVLCLSAPLAAALEWLWLGTGLSVVEMACSAAILAGVAVALTPGPGGCRPARPAVTGVLFGVLAAAGQGAGAVLSRKAFAVARLAGEDLDGLSAAYQRILGGLAVAWVWYVWVKRRPAWRAMLGALQDSQNAYPDPEPDALPLGRPGDTLSPAGGAEGRGEGARFKGSAQTRPAARRLAQWRRAWPWLAVNALAGSALGVSSFQWALKTTPTGLVLAIVALTPIVIIPLARWVEHERPTARSLAGGAVAVAGAMALALAQGRS